MTLARAEDQAEVTAADAVGRASDKSFLCAGGGGRLDDSSIPLLSCCSHSVSDYGWALNYRKFSAADTCPLFLCSPYPEYLISSHWSMVCSFSGLLCTQQKTYSPCLLGRLKISFQPVKNVLILVISTHWQSSALAISSVLSTLRSIIISDSRHSLRTTEMQVQDKWYKCLSLLYRAHAFIVFYFHRWRYFSLPIPDDFFIALFKSLFSWYNGIWDC